MRAVRFALTVGLLLAAGTPAFAQVISSPQIEDGLNPANQVYGSTYHETMPFSHRYNYYGGANLYFHGNPQRLWDLHYLDRLDRALTFGYDLPNPPPQVHPMHPGRIGVGVGVGAYRWR